MANTYKRGQNDRRPWGTWEVVDCGEGFCVKHIVVDPNGILSLQLHHGRPERNFIAAAAPRPSRALEYCTRHRNGYARRRSFN